MLWSFFKRNDAVQSGLKFLEVTGLLVRREVNLQVGCVSKQVHLANLQENQHL